MCCFHFVLRSQPLADTDVTGNTDVHVHTNAGPRTVTAMHHVDNDSNVAVAPEQSCRGYKQDFIIGAVTLM